MKKFITFLLTTTLFFSFTSLAFAEDCNGDLTYEEGAKVYVPTEEDLKMLEEKMAALIMPTIDPDGKLVTINVPCFEQETNYYCGPATVKQVIHYLNGSSQTQQQYASQLGTTTDGTDMTLIPTVLNKATGKYYLYSTLRDEESWFAKVRSSVENKQPAILDINTNGNSAFPYNSTGHFVNISGYDTQTSYRVRITDPFTKGLGNRWYYGDDLYDANYAHFRQAIIW